MGEVDWSKRDLRNNFKERLSDATSKNSQQGGLVYSLCDEVHALNTIENETITVGVAAFGAAGQLKLVKCARAQVFEIDIQSDTAGGFQLFENQTQQISAHWQLGVNQVWVYAGKIVEGDVFLTADQACNVQFEVRWRIY